MNTAFHTNHDDGSVHCLGNGRMAVYEKGPDIIQVFGPPYSSPSFMKMQIRDAGGLKIETVREPGTAIWTHNIYEGGRKVGQITDFVCSDADCFIRQASLDIRLKFKVDVESFAKTVDNTRRFGTFNIKKAILAACEPGTYIYAKYPMPRYSYHQLLAEGECSYESMDNEEFISCGKGKSTIYIVGGPSYGECITNTGDILSRDLQSALSATKKWWYGFSKRRKIFAFRDAPVPKAGSPDIPAGLKEAADSISVVIKSQQGIEGGVLAGHFYHLAYVRDQYGVSRCLLKLGYYDEARSILDFYYKIWEKYGRIHNAQAIGVDNVFHVHENDDVEITGYLIVQAFDYIKKSGCGEYINEIFPMLEWAWEAQKRHLAGGMLPFNGDETYVAGAILPRHTLNDGSAEATLLFIEGGKRLLRWVEKNGKWDKAKLEENKALLAKTAGRYRTNFYKDESIITNNPERKKKAQLPPFRHGVCEGCGAFGSTEKNENDRYLCPVCYLDKNLKAEKPKEYKLKSVSLLPLYIGSDMFSKEKIYKMVDELIHSYKKTGKLQSNTGGGNSVGYDYGFLLYNLVKLNHPYAPKIYDDMMAMLDHSCAWVEYYRDGAPSGNRYRPWESGINLEAALLFSEENS